MISRRFSIQKIEAYSTVVHKLHHTFEYTKSLHVSRANQFFQFLVRLKFKCEYAFDLLPFCTGLE